MPSLPSRMARSLDPALDDAGNVYVADIGNHRIRRIDAKSSMIDTIAGNGDKLMPRDGEAAKPDGDGEQGSDADSGQQDATRRHVVMSSRS